MTAEPTRRCFIHIGPHKTGTTSIQRFLTANVGLLAKNGVVFPMLGDDATASAHKVLMTRCLNPDGSIRRSSKPWSQVEDILKKGDKDILLSHETFALRMINPTTLNSVIRLFDEYDYGITVIAYVRSQPEWLNSWYVQQQKRLYARNTFTEFVDQWLENGRADPLRYLTGLMDNPKIKLETISFDMVIKTGLEVDFCRRLGVHPDADWTRPDVVNSNVGAKTIYVAQRVMENTDILSPKSKAYGKVWSLLLRAMRNHKWREEPFMALNDEIARSIAGKYEASNRAFLANYPIGTYEDVFPSRTYVQNVVEPSKISPEEQEALDAVVKDILQRIKGRLERETAEKRERRSKRVKGGRRQERESKQGRPAA